MAIVKKYQDYIKESAIGKEELEKYKTILNNIEDYKMVSDYIQKLIVELRENISSLEKIDFECESDDKLYLYIKYYSINSEYTISKLKNILDEAEGKDVYHKYFSLIYPDDNYVEFYPEIEIEIEHLNRIHIPIGLPYILKGCHLGFKIYKSLIYKLGYISTNMLDRSMDALFVWDSLRKDQEIYTFVRGENVLCISPELKFEQIEDLLVQFFSNLNTTEIILDDDFKTKYLPDVRKSSKISYLLNYQR
jgi:hypothetical protein